MRLLLALLTLCPALLCAEGTQGWYQNNIWLRLNEKWSIGNYLDLRADDGVGDVHTWIVSPRVRYDLNATWQLSFRDRFEWRWRDGGDEYTTRIRIRPQLDWTLHREGLFRGLYANNEVFFDFNQERVTENRLIPFGVQLRPSEHLDLRLFYLWRTTRGGQGWRHYHGLGVLASLNY